MRGLVGRTLTKDREKTHVLRRSNLASLIVGGRMSEFGGR